MKVILLIILFIISFSLNVNSQELRPVVLWHGLGDTCCYPFSMGRIKKLIEDQLPGIYVYSIEVGNSIAEDEFNGYFMNVNEQLEEVSGKLASNENLTRGANVIGFSQGGQFLRGFIERYNSPSVYNFISVGGQMMGVNGLPDCSTTNETICNDVRDLLNYGVYEELVQSHLVPAEYWSDPLNYQEYLEKSQFLADINNERTVKNDTYYKNLISINEMVLVLFSEDTIVIPKISEHFGYYEIGQDVNIIPMEETELYQQDWIGLKYLNENNKITKLSTAGNHLQFTDEWFIQNIIPYLNNTL